MSAGRADPGVDARRAHAPRRTRPTWREREDRFVAWVRRVLRLPRTWRVDGVRYKERTRVSLRRALDKHGEGVKVYDVTFPGPNAPPPMAIHATRDRVFADLAPCERAQAIEVLRPRIRPGQRVFELGCGTGAASDILSQLVGPSGGVVSVGFDRESIRFARRRYPRSNLGFELGGVETLDGEIQGAFDAVVAHTLGADSRAERENALLELWRVVAPGGTLCVRTSVGDASETTEMLVRRLLRDASVDHASTPDAGVSWIIAGRPAEKS